MVEEKIYPGYVLVEMIVTDDSWYVVRNTPNVTGFVGSGTTPLPVSFDEMTSLKEKVSREEPKYNIAFKKGDLIKIIDGPFKDSEGKVSEVDQEKGKVKVMIDMFGRNTPLELDSLQIKKYKYGKRNKSSDKITYSGRQSQSRPSGWASFGSAPSEHC